MNSLPVSLFFDESSVGKLHESDPAQFHISWLVPWMEEYHVTLGTTRRLDMEQAHGFWVNKKFFHPALTSVQVSDPAEHRLAAFSSHPPAYDDLGSIRTDRLSEICYAQPRTAEEVAADVERIVEKMHPEARSKPLSTFTAPEDGRSVTFTVLEIAIPRDAFGAEELGRIYDAIGEEVREIDLDVLCIWIVPRGMTQPFDPRRFLEVAERLASEPDEATHRTAIGRAYYAAAGAAHERYKADNGYTDIDLDHGFLGGVITGADTRPRTKISWRALGSLRVRSDYKYAAADSSAYEHVQSALENSRTVLDVVNDSRSDFTKMPNPPAKVFGGVDRPRRPS